MPRFAVLLTGQLRAYRKYIDHFIQNFVEYNDLDVYCSFQPNSSYKQRFIEHPGSEEPDVHDEEAFLREKFGSRLKMLDWVESNHSYLKNLVLFHDYEHDKILKKYTEKEPSQWFAADQFGRLALAVEKASKHDMFYKYDALVRFRIDVDVTSPICIRSLHSLQPDEVCIVRGYACSVKELFVATPKTFYDICVYFPQTMFLYAPKHYYPNFMAPEFQLAQFLRHHLYQTYEWNIEYRYVDDVKSNERKIECCSRKEEITDVKTPIILTDFISDMTPMEIVASLRKDAKLDLNIPGNELNKLTIVPSVESSDSYEMTYFILWIVFMTLFVVTNIFWWKKTSFRPFTSSSSNKYTPLK